ncbi:FMRFamide receptor-like [Plakobranchus ocellatus]|uniref:FMRFamide receptor-like n=1 Tax=Plakobranchus ocellatus TaxID=259542 RepID=A0AAV3ZIC0_9GAST|nr:FMRFamide receptor-like [Plakobranchus ocellatus]
MLMRSTKCVRKYSACGRDYASKNDTGIDTNLNMNESAHLTQGTMPTSATSAFFSDNSSDVPWCPELRDENEDKAYKQFYETAQMVTGMILYPSICFPGLLCNALSVYVLTRRNMLSSTNAFLSALAVADSIKLLNDILYFLVIVFMHTSPTLGNLSYGYLYPYSHFVFNMSLCVSSWLTVAVAVERYILVCHPTRARVVWSRRMAVILCTAIYVVMTCFAIPFALRYRTIRCVDRASNLYRLEVEVTEMWQNETFRTVYTWIQNLMRSIIPLIVLIILNMCIICALKKTRIKRRKLPRHRVTVMMIAVILTFLVCVTPDAILSTIFGFGYHEASYLAKGIREITDTLLGVNAGVNFLIYCAFNKVFRKSFTRLCCPQVPQTGWVTEMDETTYRRLSEAKPTAHSNNNSSPRHGKSSRCNSSKRTSSSSISTTSSRYLKHKRRGERLVHDKNQDTTARRVRKAQLSVDKEDSNNVESLHLSECDDETFVTQGQDCGCGSAKFECGQNDIKCNTDPKFSSLNGLAESCSGSHSLPIIPFSLQKEDGTFRAQQASESTSSKQLDANYCNNRQKSFSQPELPSLEDECNLCLCSCSNLRSYDDSKSLICIRPNQPLNLQNKTSKLKAPQSTKMRRYGIDSDVHRNGAQMKSREPRSKIRQRPSNGLKKSKNSVKSQRAKRRNSYTPSAYSDSDCAFSESGSFTQSERHDIATESCFSCTHGEIIYDAASSIGGHCDKLEKKSKLSKFVPPCIDGKRRTCRDAKVSGYQNYEVRNSLTNFQNCDGTNLTGSENNNGTAPLLLSKTGHSDVSPGRRRILSSPACGAHKHGTGQTVRFEDVPG